MSSAAARTLTWVTRQGREDPIASPPRAYEIPRISPDGTRVALSRLTFSPGNDYSPVWTHDSLRIIFGSERDEGVPNLYWQAADNTGTIERLTTSPNAQFPTSISPDRSRVLFHEVAPKTSTDIDMLVLKALETAPGQTPAALQAAGARFAAPFIQTSFRSRPAVGPDPCGRGAGASCSTKGTER